MHFRKKTDRIGRWFFLIILAAVFVLNACGNGKQAGQAPPPPQVAVQELKTEAVVLTTELPGRTSAYLIAEVRPQVSGIIKERLFTEGSVVKAGDLLYQIDPDLFQAACESAKASLARAEANLPAMRTRAERYGELISSKAISQQDYDDVRSALKQAEAEVQYWKAAAESARINLEYTSVTAPISGRTGRSNVTKGALVTMNQPIPLVTIQQLDPIYVDVPQSTAELLRLRHSLEKGYLEKNGADQNKVRLLLEDDTEYPLEGTLQFQDVTVDRSTGTVTLRAVFPNPDNFLLPGMFVRAVLQEGVNKQAILIPQQAVSRDPKGNPLALLVNPQGMVEQRQLTIDRAIGNQWLVTSGLAVGERLIVEGIQRIRPGMPVQVAPPSEDTTAQGTEAGPGVAPKTEN